MKLGFKKFIKRGQKGITLVELMVVMAILAVLASIIFPAVSGTQEVSVNSQTKQDASTVGNAMNDYFADQTGAEIISSSAVAIVADNQSGGTDQTISTRWPENFITAIYSNVFANNTNNVTAINLIPKEGANILPIEFVHTRTAINFAKEGSKGLFVPLYVPAVPKSSTDESGNFNNYLWVTKKTTASGGASDASRQLEVWRLSSVVQSVSSYVLNYEQIY